MSATGAGPTGVGREVELAELTALVERAASGTGGALLLVGEGGVGKTWLARAAARGEAGSRLRVVRALPAVGPQPYDAWRQVLRQIGQVTPGLERAAERSAVFDEVVDAVASAAPLLLVVEDLHALDEDSCRLLEHAAPRLVEAPVALLVTTRPLPGDQQHAAAQAAEAVARAGVRLPIVPFTPQESALHLVQVAGEPLAAEVVERLHRATGGNPLFLGEVVRLLRAQGRLRDPGPRLGVPDGVRAVVAQRLRALPPDTVSALQDAAVLGPTFPLPLLSALAPEARADVAQALAPAVAAGLCRLDGATGAFVHDLLYEAVLTEIDPARRPARHAAVARLLAQRGARDEEVVAHAVAAGLPADLAPVVRPAAERAARDALGHAAVEAAAQHVAVALAALEALPAEDAAVRGGLLVLAAQAAAGAGRLGAARQAALDAAALLGDQDPDLLAEAALAAPSTAGFLVVDRAVVDLLERALTAGPSPVLRARLLSRLAAELLGDEASAARRGALVAQAQAQARASGEPRALAEALAAVLQVRWGEAAAGERLRVADELLAAARAAGADDLEMEARLWRVGCRLEQADGPGAEREVAGYEQRAAQLRRPVHRMYACSRRATLHVLSGRFDEGLALVAEAERHGRQAEVRDVARMAMAQRASVTWWRAGPDELATAAEALAEVLLTFPGLLMEPLLAACRLQAGDVERARTDLQAGVRALRASSAAHPSAVPALFRAVEVAVVLGERELLAELMLRLEPHRGRVVVAAGAVACLGSASFALGLGAAALGRPADAEALLREALGQHASLGARPLQAATEWELGRLLLAGGDPRGGPLQERALTTAQELGLRWFGLRPVPATGSGAATSRPTYRLQCEGEVWTLAAEGRVTRLRDSRGLHQLARLLAAPGQDVPAAVLAGGADEVGGADAVLDPAALAGYRRRLAELDAELAAADTRGDAERAQAVEAERQALLRELRRATGLGGRPRRFSDEGERARVNVTRTLRQALQRIAAADPQVGAHLLRSVRTGVLCRYACPEDDPVAWVL